MIIHNRLQEILKERNLLQKFLVEELCAHYQLVSRWCRNKYQPSNEWIPKLEKLLKLKRDEIFYIDYTAGR